jgi:hypothetical protein
VTFAIVWSTPGFFGYFSELNKSKSANGKVALLDILMIPPISIAPKNNN